MLPRRDTDEEPDLSVLLERGWLADARAALQERIISAGHRLALRRGDLLFAHEDNPGGIYGIVSGSIGVEGATSRHPLRLGHVFRPGAWLGHGPVLTGKRRTSRLFAMEPSELLHIPLALLETLKREDPTVRELLVRLSVAVEVLGNWVACDLLIPEAPRRIAAVLLRVSGMFDGVEHPDPIGLMISQSQIAEMANVSRSYTNQILATLSAEGWIEVGFLRVRVLDPTALGDFAYAER